MKKFLFVAIIVLWVVPAVALVPPYTITPWRYGVIAWVQSPSTISKWAVNQALQAVEYVFSTWDQPRPTPAERWDQLKPMPRGAWNDASYDPFIAGFLPVPSPTSDDIWEIPLPSWKGEKILPLILIVFPDENFMDEWTSNYTAGGLFNYWYAKEGIGTGIPLVSNRSLWQLVHRSYSITYSYTTSSATGVTETLHHELAHWLFYLTCSKEGIDPDSFPSLITEGFPEYTAYPSMRESYWGVDAAFWAKDHDLTHVPYFMSYPVGASVINALVARDGADQVLNDLPDISRNWDQAIADITPFWREQLSAIDLTEADRAYYEANIEQLYVCSQILDPILSPEARALVSTLYDKAGTMDDILRFWQIVSSPTERPSDAVWAQMRPGEKMIAEVGSSYQDKDLQNQATVDEFRLRELRELGKWDEYYDLLITSLRTVIAHYGTLPVEETTR